MKKEIRKEQGITLIALVVTLVILIILAAISIYMILGDNGILSKATQASETFQIEQGREQINLAVVGMQTEKLSKGESCPLEYIAENIEDRLNGCEVVGTQGNPMKKVYVKYSGYQYEIDEMGNVTFIGNVDFNEIPYISIIRNTTVTGVESVTLDITAEVEVGQVKTIVTPQGEVQGNNTNYVVTENGTYIFKAITESGVETQKAVKIENIKQSGIDLTGMTTGEEISHTHIYETKFDDSYHWEECFICKDIQNKTAHTLTKEWSFGYESCERGNSCTTYCIDGCGYRKVETKSHVSDKQIHYNKARYWHFSLCENCNTDLENERCYKIVDGQKILLSCGKAGTCAVCGAVYDGTEPHNLDYKGDCMYCNNIKGAISSETTLEYHDNTNSITVTSIVTPANGTILPSTWGTWTGYEDILTIGKVSVENLSDGKQKLTCEVTIKDGYLTISTMTFTGTFTVADGQLANCTQVGPLGTGYEQPYFIPDRVAPSVQDITIDTRDVVNGFARQVSITANFTETKDTVVEMALYDGNTIISDWGVATRDGTNFTRIFDVIAETSEEKELTVKARDRCGNIGEGKITISKLDSKAPELKSETVYNEPWSRNKEIQITATDIGIGNVQIAFNNPEDYQLASVTNGIYTRKYNFTGDVYEDVVGAVYLKDELENVTTEKIIIGKIDSTSPTITDVIIETNNITVKASDINTTLGKEGAGVESYAISTTKELPSDTNFQTNNTFKVEIVGTYYIWVKDAAGNLSERYEIQI